MKIQLSQKRYRYLPWAIAAIVCLLLLAGGLSGSNTVTCTEERVAYLEELGWCVDPESESAQTVCIPGEFSDVYTRYNELQQQQGFDLRDYAGKECTLYSYQVTNALYDDTLVLADLYIKNDRVIAGDIHSTALNGFMVGIR